MITLGAATLLALSLAADVTVSSLRALARADRLLSPRLRACVAGAVLGLVALGSLRPPDARAAMAPPSQRILGVVGESGPGTETSHERQTASTTVAISSTSTYEVVPGDCLWKIARSILRESGRSPTGLQITDLWKEIYRLNAEVIGPNPNLIHPGQVLEVPSA